MWGEKTDGSFSAYDGVVDVVVDRVTGYEIPGWVTHAILTLLESLPNSISVWQVIVGTAGQEHVVDHVFSETFVAVKRMELPPGVEPDSQAVDDDAKRQQNNNCAGN